MAARLLLFAALMLAVPGPGFAQPLEDEAAVEARERDWSDAYLAHDLDRLSSILADDFVGFDSRGVMSTKADELREAAPQAAAGAPPIVSEHLSDLKVRVYGDTAILTALNTVSFAGEAATTSYRRTTVWIRTPAGWRCVSFHASRAPASP